MAFSTVNFTIAPENGWVLIATNPTYVAVASASTAGFSIAVTAGGAPAASLQGLPLGFSLERSRQPFVFGPFPLATVSEVYARALQPGGQTLTVIRDQ